MIYHIFDIVAFNVYKVNEIKQDQASTSIYS
jgi:hypothetical protein